MSGIISIMVVLVWFAVLAAASSCSPSALVATLLFFWLMNMESIWKPPENSGIRNRPIWDQVGFSHFQNWNVGIDARSMPMKEKLISRSLAPSRMGSAFSSSRNSPR